MSHAEPATPAAPRSQPAAVSNETSPEAGAPASGLFHTPGRFDEGVASAMAYISPVATEVITVKTKKGKDKDKSGKPKKKKKMKTVIEFAEESAIGMTSHSQPISTAANDTDGDEDGEATDPHAQAPQSQPAVVAPVVEQRPRSTAIIGPDYLQQASTNQLSATKPISANADPQHIVPEAQAAKPEIIDIVREQQNAELKRLRAQHEADLQRQRDELDAIRRQQEAELERKRAELERQFTAATQKLDEAASSQPGPHTSSQRVPSLPALSARPTAAAAATATVIDTKRPSAPDLFRDDNDASPLFPTEQPNKIVPIAPRNADPPAAHRTAPNVSQPISVSKAPETSFSSASPAYATISEPKPVAGKIVKPLFSVF